MAALSYQITYLPVGRSVIPSVGRVSFPSLMAGRCARLMMTRSTSNGPRIFAWLPLQPLLGSCRLCSRFLKLQMLSGLMGSYHPLQACAFRRFMDLPAHMKLRWQSFPHKRIVTTVLSAPAVNSSCPRQPSRAWRTSGGTRLTQQQRASQVPEIALKEEGARLACGARRLMRQGRVHGSPKRPTPCLKPH